ncbi:hypothetical protein SJ05684_b42300 (plasmid) [Sinorhizobium sojae CCBAU 05684]|uniref:Uncharacterized protein n=1 Tax=Sinorhizobium sojae CCBAU 05684 TaxID=716928 RepID=A0A249PHJ6_9HYPH|nr:hypothetical protein [Sinorhizobium sojae]ASY65212.1 hypothetical protein SJ05684_b42300 [Sinorhizobium sojae CCBAU 05684]
MDGNLAPGVRARLEMRFLTVVITLAIKLSPAAFSVSTTIRTASMTMTVW